MRNLLKITIVIAFGLMLLAQTIQAEVYSSISGRVIGEDTGEGVSDAVVTLYKVDNDDRTGIVPIDQVHTNADGLYFFKDVSSGSYKIKIEKYYSQYILANSPQLTALIQSGKNVVNANFMLPVGKMIQGTVYHQGTPLPQERTLVWVEVLDPTPSWAINGGTVEIDASGHYSIQGLPVSGEMFMYIDLHGYAHVRKKFNLQDFDKNKIVDFFLNWNDITGIHGQVRNIATNNAIRNVEIHLINSETGSVIGTVFSGEGGNYAIVGVAPGVYEVKVYWSGPVILKSGIVIKKDESTEVNLEIERN